MIKWLLFLLVIPVCMQAQKEIYIPWEWQQPNGLDYSLTRSAASENFVVFWGPLATDDPTQAPGDLAFVPSSILQTAEDLYAFYIDSLHFVRDDTGVISQYKIILVMLHTWDNLEGWAFGGSYDATVGAMWMHPQAALSGPTLAHEFTHTLQNYAWILNPGHGFIDSSYVGFFWETHAEFMALQYFPSVALEFDMARWLNTCQFHWSSTRHHYQGFVFLQYIKELDGISMINRMWNESIIGEHPLQTYKRLKGITQEELNLLFADYAMRNVNWDYEIGDDLRTRVATLPQQFVAHPTIIPAAVDTGIDWYRIQNHLAPQDYGYNIIEIFPKSQEGCEKKWVRIHLQMQYIANAIDRAGIRFGMVALDAQGNSRYSDIHEEGDEFTFEMEDGEERLFLVVIGAPEMHHNYRYEAGFPRIWRYPYDFRIENGWPLGYQPGYRSVDPGIAGAPHSNGGGFVAATANVAPTAFVGPHAQVLDQAQVLDNAVIDDFAIVRQNAIISSHAIVRDHAIVGEDGRVSGNAVIRDHAHIYGGSHVYDNADVSGNTLIFFTSVYEDAVLTDNTFCWGADLHGDVRLGGDAEFFSECADGTYLQVDFAYDRFCDGLDDHPANVDLTKAVPAQKLVNSHSLVCDDEVINQENIEYIIFCAGDTILYQNTPLSEEGLYTFYFEAADGADSVIYVVLDHYILPTILTDTILICKGDTVWFDTIALAAEGQYEQLFYYGDSCSITYILEVEWFPVDTTLVLSDHSLFVQQPSQNISWYDCATGLQVQGAASIEFSPAEPGWYQALIETQDGCITYTECVEVLSVGIQTISTTNDYSITPNPVSDVMKIQINHTSTTDLHLEICDMPGRILSSVSISPDEKEIFLPIGFLQPGMYILRNQNQNFRHNSHLFVKN